MHSLSFCMMYIAYIEWSLQCSECANTNKSWGQEWGAPDLSPLISHCNQINGQANDTRDTQHLDTGHEETDKLGWKENLKLLINCIRHSEVKTPTDRVAHVFAATSPRYLIFACCYCLFSWQFNCTVNKYENLQYENMATDIKWTSEPESCLFPLTQDRVKLVWRHIQ